MYIHELCIYVYNTHIYIYIYIYIYKKKKLLKVKSQVEVLASGAYVFESQQSFNKSQVKLTTCFSRQTYS